MNNRRLAGAVSGALVAGLGLTAMMMAQERRKGAPSELIDLERAAAGKFSRPTPPAARMPSLAEQGVTQGGHLLLSAVAGAAYAAASDEDTPVVAGGILFGLAFYGVAHWLVGPVLGVKPPEWRADPAQIAMHTANHVAFGLATAAAASVATNR